MRQEAERRRRKEEAGIQHLYATVAAWAKARQIRSFVAAVKEARLKNGGVASGGDIENLSVAKTSLAGGMGRNWTERHLAAGDSADGDQR